MKELGFCTNYTFYNNNYLFDPNSKYMDGDGSSHYTFRYLAKEANKHGIHVSTIDTQPLDSYDAIFFLDFPTFKNQYFKKLIKEKFENLYLFMWENETIIPDNWKKENFQYFKRLYTWNDKIVDNKKFFKFFFPHRIPTGLSFELSQRKNFCCMIAANKSSNHNLELYSERVRAIRWFEKNAPQSFDLFGTGWNDYTFNGVLRPLNEFKALKKLVSPFYPSYKGAIKSKPSILKDYKFSICYENARDIPGYITEKIFDSFFAGCVPIYWGAPNITDFIPENTFIDRKKFDTYKELFDYMWNMSETEYLNYIYSIEKFVNGPQIYPFSANNFCDTIFRLIEEKS